MALRSEAKREYDRVYYLENRERLIEKSREYKRNNREAHNQRSRDWREQNPEKLRLTIRKCHLKRKYGISLLEWQQIFESQNCQCAICETTEPGGNGWHTDHIHGTKIVRGILCNKCNVSLHDGDTPDLLRKKADYLERNGY